MKKIYPLLIIVIAAQNIARAQAPAGYYNNASGYGGQTLRGKLHDIIKDHTAITYGELWAAFATTDKNANGKVWDIYSDKPGSTPSYEYTFGTDQCGNYNSEGDCYNREHSWPQSYFNEQSPMVSDLFHIYPTDGWVNNKRSNDPYGVVDSTASYWQSENGSRSGNNVYPGYTGKVFEPIDSFKGDLARTYFYMSTRYYGEDAGWENWASANGAELQQWTIDMLLEWHQKDPVSTKETERNNAIYAIQHNRNPFIDYPEFANCIWSNTVCNNPTSLVEWQLANQTKVYPNPAGSHLNIDLSGIDVQETIAVDLWSVTGILIYHKDLEARRHKIEIQLAPAAKGIYMLRLKASSGVAFKKVLVR
ncbi:MAG: endonuclease [Edaphocola sp.]